MQKFRIVAGCLGMLLAYAMSGLIWVGAVWWYYSHGAAVWGTVWLLLPPIAYVLETFMYLFTGQWIAFVVMLSPVLGFALIGWGMDEKPLDRDELTVV